MDAAGRRFPACARLGYRRRRAGLGYDHPSYRRQGVRTVWRGDHRPFNPSGVGVLAAWADGGIDISHEQIYSQEPEAVWAIHDLHYATRPQDFDELRYRLQLLAEQKMGTALRRQAAIEDAKVAKAREAAES